jgi:hypothetical protein
MTHSSRSLRITFAAAALAFAATALPPASSRADMPDAGSLVDYGFKGFTLGLELGLAVGYITTGPKWQQSEWKNLVIGMGVGALSGMTTGIVIAVADSTADGVPGGYYLLRDAGYGTLLGATMGGVVGMLFWVDDGSSKDVLQGAAWGSIFGAGAGLVYGVIEAAHAKPRGRDGWGDDEDALLEIGHDVRVSVAPGLGGMSAVVWGPIDF